MLIVGLAFLAAPAALVYWYNRLPDQRKGELFGVVFILIWVAFMLGLYVAPYLSR